MSTGLLIRPQAPRDAAAIEALQRRAYVEDLAQDDALDADIERDTRYLVGEVQDGRVIACIGAVAPGSARFYFERLISFGDPRLPGEVRRENTSEGDGLVVAPDYAGRGFGRLLFCAITLEMEAMGATFAVGLCTDSSRRLAGQTGARSSGIQFRVGNTNEELMCSRISEMSERARPWLTRALRDGKLRLSPALDPRLERVREAG